MESKPFQRVARGESTKRDETIDEDSSKDEETRHASPSTVSGLVYARRHGSTADNAHTSSMTHLIIDLQQFSILFHCFCSSNKFFSFFFTSRDDDSIRPI